MTNGDLWMFSFNAAARPQLEQYNSICRDKGAGVLTTGKNNADDNDAGNWPVASMSQIFELRRQPDNVDRQLSFSFRFFPFHD